MQAHFTLSSTAPAVVPRLQAHRVKTTTSSPSRPGSSAALPLLALAAGAFGIGTTEFSPMGLLPVIADGVHVSIPQAGMLISAYAIGVMVGAPLMTLLLARWSRRSALIALMSIFTIGNLLSAFAPGRCCSPAS